MAADPRAGRGTLLFSHVRHGGRTLQRFHRGRTPQHFYGGLVGPHIGVVCSLLLLALAGCREPPPPDVVSDVVERGPLRLTIEAGPRNPRIGDAVKVSLIVEAPENYEVQFPDANEIGGHEAREIETPDPRPGAVGMVWRRSLEIDPLASGPLEIPPLVVKYRRAAAGAETQPAFENELVSGTLTLEVASVLTDQDDPSRPRDITGTLLPPGPPLPAWQKALLAAGALTVAAVGVLLYRAIRRRALRPPPPVLPEVWALRLLAELDSPDWLSPERLREFYYRVTEALRGYVERKFGLAAPEMTTEEFLLALARDRAAVPYDADRFRVFLEACDSVKYAALRPTREDAQDVLATARAFINATAAIAEQTATVDQPGEQAA